MTPQQEILDAAVVSRSQARPMVNRAQKHFREARRATIQVMADLRLLQDGGVHLLYGEKNFAKWAEETFDGLAAGNVRQLTRAGAVALELERRGLIDLSKPEGVGTTGLRELSVIANDFGDDKMVEIFLQAREMVEDRKEVAGTTVKAAMALLMPPANVELDVPASLVIAVAGEGGADEDEDDTDDPRYERIHRIQDLLYDVTTESDAYAEAMAEMVRLGKELKGEKSSEDQDWLESSR